MPIIDTFDSDKLNTIETFRNLGAEADEFERYPNPHAARIAVIADHLARSFNLGGHDRFSLRVAALAHDLGEVTMEREYIQRPGSLDDEERIDLARHPVIGEREAANAGADRGAQLLVRWHHESWNGSGYPDGLRFEQIPLGARILRVADTYAALTDARPFRAAYSESEAREHLLEWTGLEFDPVVVRALLALDPVRELQSYARIVEVTPEPMSVSSVPTPDLSGLASG
jgi:HD-GYP domain-containing protein (c-di-GMP phosphodiesterase class II)